MTNMHYLSAVYPMLQWHAGTDSDEEEAGRWLSGLDDLFSHEELNLSGGEPPQATLPGRLATHEFWQLASQGATAKHYSPATRFYMENCLAMKDFSAFEDYMRVWACAFYTVRMDFRSMRDVLLLFLQQNLGCLKDLYILDQDGNRDIAPAADAMQACLNQAANRNAIARPWFSAWVLNNWLPLHLQHYHRGVEEAAATGAAAV